MDIVCPQCKTEYEFDERHVTPTGVSVQCTNCGFTFKVRRREVVEIDADGQGRANEPDPATAHPWMIRTTGGDLLNFRELATLQQWIIDRRVSPQDQISRTGDQWKLLGEIPELATFFSAAQANAQRDREAESGQGPVSTGPTTAGEEPLTLGSMDSVFADEPAFARDDADLAPVSRGAAWERSNLRMSTSGPYEPLDDDYRVPRRGGGKFLALALLSLLLVGLGGLFVAKPEIAGNLFKGLFKSEAPSDAIYAEARQLFLKDDRASLDAADKKLAQIKVQGALVRAARAEIYTVWAQHLRDQAEILQRKAIAREAKAKALFEQSQALARRRRGATRKSASDQPSNPPDDPKTLRARGDALRAESLALQQQGQQLLHRASEKLNVARAQLRVAKGAQAERAEVSRAAADLRRLEGQRGVMELLGKVRRTKPDDAEAHYVEGLFRAGRGDMPHAVAALRSAIAEMRAQYKQPLLRSATALAMLHLKQEQYDKAIKRAEAVLAENDRHDWSQAILEQAKEELRGDIALPALEAAASTGDTPVSAAANDQAEGGDEQPAASAKSPPEGTPGAPPSSAQEDSPRQPKTSTTSEPTPSRRTYESLIKAGNRASEHGRTMRALDYFERALKQRASGLEALTGLGYAQLDLQRFTTAMGYFRRAIKLSPGYGEATIGMAEAYLALGNKGQALDYYKAYLRAHPAGRRASLARRNVKDLERAIGGVQTPPAATPPAASATDEPSEAGEDAPDSSEPARPEASEDEPTADEPTEDEPTEDEPAADEPERPEAEAAGSETAPSTPTEAPGSADDEPEVAE
jgi:predicted Zn finger-like uncharacterized protein